MRSLRILTATALVLTALACRDDATAPPEAAGAADGDLAISPDGEHTFTVWCKEGKEYLTLVNTGGASNFSQYTTTRRALALGYPVVLVSDGHTTLDNTHLSASQIIAHHNETLSNITSFGPVVRLELAQDVSFVA